MDYDMSNKTEKSKLAALRSIEEVRKRLNIQQILGADYHSKVKVRISHSVPHFWNSIQTIVEGFCDKEGLDVKIVLSPLYPNYSSKLEYQMKEGGYRYIYSDNYNIETDKPDIVVFNIAQAVTIFESWGGIDTIRKNAKYLAVIPYDNSVKFESDDRMNAYYDILNDLRADIFIIAKPIYDVIKNRYANTVQMDSPKFDVIYRKLSRKSGIPEDWKKLDGKKVILWTTVHGHDEWYPNTFFVGLTFDIYIKEVLNYFKKHKNMGLIFRPHPAYVEELVYRHKIWTEADLQCIKDYFKNSENMVWDDSEDYSNAFVLSDALMTDDGTGITLSYLPTRKPICILRRNNIEFYTGTSKVIENYYKSHNFTELHGYFEMIEQEKDPFYEARMRTVEDYITIFDGKNGIRIVNKIMGDYTNKRNKNLV